MKLYEITRTGSWASKALTNSANLRLMIKERSQKFWRHSPAWNFLRDSPMAVMITEWRLQKDHDEPDHPQHLAALGCSVQLLRDDIRTGRKNAPQGDPAVYYINGFARDLKGMMLAGDDMTVEEMCKIGRTSWSNGYKPVVVTKMPSVLLDVETGEEIT